MTYIGWHFNIFLYSWFILSIYATFICGYLPLQLPPLPSGPFCMGTENDIISSFRMYHCGCDSLCTCVWETDHNTVSSCTVLTVRLALFWRGSCIHYVNGWKNIAEDASGDNNATNLPDKVTSGFELLALWTPGNTYPCSCMLLINVLCFFFLRVLYILLDDFMSSWKETHQETDKTGSKAHQRALSPAERVKKGDRAEESQEETNMYGIGYSQ